MRESPGDPEPIAADESRRRASRARRLARSLGFVGRVEYRHVTSQSGGAQYARSGRAEADLLTVYAEAFVRDADPDDFSLRAIIAHERGHQVLGRNPKLTARMVNISLEAEEVLASVVGAALLPEGEDRDSLLAKAMSEVLSGGVAADTALRMVEELFQMLGELL